MQRSNDEIERVLGLFSWSRLEHAYGRAADLPELFRSIGDRSATTRKKAFDRLWSSLYHQDSTYSASFAALPVIAALVDHARTRADLVSLVQLAGAIDMWSSQRSTAHVPARALRDARKKLRKHADALLSGRLSRWGRAYLSVSLLAFKGARKKALAEYARLDEDASSDDVDDDRELVARVKFRRERGLIYYLDEDGDIGVRRNLPGRVVSEKVFRVGIKRQRGWAYQLDGQHVYRTRVS